MRSRIRTLLRRWLRPDTHIRRLDPHVLVWTALPPRRSDAYWDRLWTARVAANVARRDALALETAVLPVFLRRQAD
jgi:hypothetical protein